MINSKEYISLMNEAYLVFPKLHGAVVPDYFFENIDVLRQQHKSISSEFNYYRQYPRHKMDRFNEAVEIMSDLCKKTDVVFVLSFPEGKEIDEHDWARMRKLDHVVKFYFNDVDITGIIDLYGKG